MILLVYGWTYVNWVTLKRSNPFTSGNGHYLDIKILLFCAPILFLLSGVIVLRQPHDLSGYCTTPEQGQASRIMLKASHEDKMLWAEKVITEQQDEMILLHTLQHANYLGDYQSVTPECRTYTSDEVMSYNLWAWATAFIIFGINFSHMDVGPMQHFSLDPSVMKTWGVGLWIMFLALLVLLGVLVLNAYHSYVAAGCALRYLIGGAIIAAYMFLNTKKNTK